METSSLVAPEGLPRTSVVWLLSVHQVYLFACLLFRVAPEAYEGPRLGVTSELQLLS